jgi:hypothetical protein
MQNKKPQTDIAPLPDRQDQLDELIKELDEARQRLLEAEAELAEEQAAVNAFRMHCRLKLDAWIEALNDLQTRKQSLLTRLQLMRQAKDMGIQYDDKDPFWQTEEFADESTSDRTEDDDQNEALILPTDTPRDKAAEKRLYRELARKFHPDLGITAVEIAYRTEMMSAVNVAYEREDVQALYDLSGELDPGEAAEVAAIKSKEIRQLRRQLFQCKRRRQRARRRLSSLRNENTARLWRKARYLDETGTDWWEIVRREIKEATDRVRIDVDGLEHQIEYLVNIQENPSNELHRNAG